MEYHPPKIRTKRCETCRWREVPYRGPDLCCSHDPPPKGIPDLMVDRRGVCGYWKGA